MSQVDKVGKTFNAEGLRRRMETTGFVRWHDTQPLTMGRVP